MTIVEQPHSASRPDPRPAHSRPVLTRSAARCIEEEISRLQALKHDERAQRFRDATHGDEDEDLAIREDEAILDARIAGLNDIVMQATVVDDHQPREHGLIGIGSIAEVEDVALGQTWRYEVVAWHDGAKPWSVSVGSPVGQALLGRAVGESVVIELPQGRARELRVIEVEAPGAVAA